MKNYSAFYPGKPWYDTNGVRIQAHSGQLTYLDGTYYLYGEDKTPVRSDNDYWHAGVRLYSSQDLYNWMDEGTILHTSDDPENPLFPQRIMDRPHILYNEKTRKFVLWAKFGGVATKTLKDYSQQFAGIAISDSIRGPFELVRTIQPLGMQFGDFDLVKDPESGKAWLLFSQSYKNLIVADLTEDYMDVTGRYTSHFPHSRPPYVREGITYFSRNQLSYILSSGTTGYYPNLSEAAVADQIHGPYRILCNPHTNDVHRTSFDSQISCVFKHPFKRDLYIVLADRWVANLPEERPDFWAYFEARFSGDPDALRDFDLEKYDPYVDNINTSIAGYVWLPLRFEGDTPWIDWHDEWRIEDYE